MRRSPSPRNGQRADRRADGRIACEAAEPRFGVRIAQISFCRTKDEKSLAMPTYTGYRPIGLSAIGKFDRRNSRARAASTGLAVGGERIGEARFAASAGISSMLPLTVGADFRGCVSRNRKSWVVSCRACTLRVVQLRAQAASCPGRRCVSVAERLPCPAVATVPSAACACRGCTRNCPPPCEPGP